MSYVLIQRYEAGAIRISVDTLFRMALRLGVRPEAFFEGLPPPAPPDDAAERSILAFLATPEGCVLVRCFPKIPPRQRRGVLDLVRSLGPKR